MIENVNCSLHKLGRTDSDTKGYYRFLSNDKVEEQLLIKSLQDQCSKNVGGKRVLAFCDTSSINIDNHKNRIKDFSGLGRIGKNQHKQSFGFLIHPILIYESHSGIALGVSDMEFISRPMIAARPKSKRWETKDIPIEEKESYKWIGPCLSSIETSLSQVEHVTFIMDREGDIMEVYDRIKGDRSDLLVRCKHNRKVLDNQGQIKRLYDLLAEEEVKGQMLLQINGPKRKKRKTKLDIRFSRCVLQWHTRQKTSFKNNEKGIEVSIIEVREQKPNGYPDEPPLVWRLITTQQIQTLNQVKEQIEYYSQRWRVEEFFKLLKTDGYNIQSTQLTSGRSIRKLTLMIMKASIKILQLKAARKGEGDQKVEDVFNGPEIECLEKLNIDLQGDTNKQKNPYPKEHLAWASWIIARLGGWKEYYAQNRPPGNKTFVWGLEKFDSMMYIYNILNKKDVS